jgi:hypothetical protein
VGEGLLSSTQSFSDSSYVTGAELFVDGGIAQV